MKLYDVVQIKETNSLLDGQIGRIIGKSFEDVGVEMYIILLDREYRGQRGVVLPNAVLERL